MHLPHQLHFSSGTFSEGPLSVEKFMARQQVNEQVEVIVPTAFKSLMWSPFLQTKDLFYYRAQVSLLDLIVDMKTQLTQGDIYGTTLNTPVDRSNAISVEPPGILRLQLTPAVYEQWGSKVRGKKVGAWVHVDIPLADFDLEPSQAFLSAFFPVSDMIFCRFARGECQRIEFPARVHYQRIEMNWSTYSVTSSNVPDFSEKQQQQQRVWHWIGCITCRLDNLLQGEIMEDDDPFISTFASSHLPTTNNGPLCAISSYRCRGLLNGKLVAESIVPHMQQVMKERPTCPWIAVACWGMEDFVSQESTGAASSYVLICLPEDRYLFIHSQGMSSL